MAAIRRVDRGDGTHLAARLQEGAGPTILFLPGYQSDMTGSKASHLLSWAARTGRRCLLFDYSGCGQSEGAFDDGTIGRWTADALAVAAALAPGPLLPVGSSMGGWIMLHLALHDPGRIRALVGLAAAPDFTRWGLAISKQEQALLARQGFFTRPSPYGAPERVARAFLDDARGQCLLGGAIPLSMPVRLLHGTADAEVPPAISRRLMRRLSSADVQLTLVKGGDHRLSSPAALALLERTLEELLQ